MINIVSTFYPYRLTAASKESVELEITIKNVNTEVTLLSYEIGLEHTLAFDRKGTNRAQSFRLGDIKANESKSFKFQIYGVEGIRPGIHRIKVVVNEHFTNYEHINSKTEKIIEIRVV